MVVVVRVVVRVLVLALVLVLVALERMGGGPPSPQARRSLPLWHPQAHCGVCRYARHLEVLAELYVHLGTGDAGTQWSDHHGHRPYHFQVGGGRVVERPEDCGLGGEGGGWAGVGLGCVAASSAEGCGLEGQKQGGLG